MGLELTKMHQSYVFFSNELVFDSLRASDLIPEVIA